MKKLLLTSGGLGNPKIGEKVLGLVDKPASEIKVLFIPTASRSEEDILYIDKSRKELINLGILDENINSFNLDRELTDEEKNNSDAVYVCGGNTFYLLHKVRESGFDEVLKRLIDKGVVYVGVSAGSIILGPDIELTATPDPNDINLQDTKGLGLVDAALSPHYCKEEEEIVKEWSSKADYEILPLTDNQALLVTDDKTEIIE